MTQIVVQKLKRMFSSNFQKVAANEELPLYSDSEVSWLRSQAKASIKKAQAAADRAGFKVNSRVAELRRKFPKQGV